MLKYIDEFNDAGAARVIASDIARMMTGRDRLTIMEVCGTHTMAIHRHGIRDLLPANLRLLSGPGCPVCVTPNGFVDRAVALARLPDVTIATFGDMIRVPGSTSSLHREKAHGADVRAVYSSIDAVRLARQLPGRRVVFLGVGFETTAPTVAASLREALRSGLANYFVLCAHKIIPPAMRILSGGLVDVDGFLCPPHVSAIIGADPYDFLATEFGKACVITGFEPLDILEGIRMLLRQMCAGRSSVEIQYDRVVRSPGNVVAQGLLQEVFEPCDTRWRGIGMLAASGLRIREKYAAFDAERTIPVSVEQEREPAGCICGDIITGVQDPPSCRLFARACTPDHPVGACMVSGEGTCAAWYAGRPVPEGVDA